MGRLGGFELLASVASDFAHRKVMLLRDMAYGDSPIEQIFSAALMTVAEWNSRSVDYIQHIGPNLSFDDAKDGIAAMGRPSTTAFIEKQVLVAGWRVDFLIHYPVRSAPKIDGWPTLGKLIVECDGHAFHERTKEQAARDRQRDRIAQHQGLPVLRFTGSEIWNDPVGCADEVLQFIESGPGQTR